MFCLLMTDIILYSGFCHLRRFLFVCVCYCHTPIWLRRRYLGIHLRVGHSPVSGLLRYNKGIVLRENLALEEFG